MSSSLPATTPPATSPPVTSPPATSPARAGAERRNGQSLGAVLGALSHALDLTEGQPAGHCLRSAWLAYAVAEEIGLDEGARSDVYFTALCKDLGCSSNAARICELYLADDLAFKRDFKLIDGSLSSALRFVLSHTGTGSQLTERVGAIVNILRNGGEIARSLIETRCERGADIAARIGLSESVQDGIRSLDEHWNGAGKAAGLAGEAIPLPSRIALVAQVADIFHVARGREAARCEVRARAGTWFEPRLAEAVADLPDDVWSALASDDIETRVLALPPALRSDRPDEDRLDAIANAFAQVVDAKSPFTANHSERVALYADMIAAELGHGADERRVLRRAGLLHDLGKLGVSNDILDKNGRPTEDEWATIRMHPVHGERILSRVDAFKDLAPLALSHHERLDGAGYPNGVAAEALDLPTRILSVADVFDALSADRPYRAAMPLTKVLATMREDVAAAFDGDVFAALERALAKSELFAGR